ncbi:hypothetical protein Tco_0609121 [Tanacetum coccineum]
MTGCLVKIHKLILDQWELNKTVTNVSKEVKRLKLEDKVPRERSKCVHYGNIWNKTFTSSSKSGLTESNGGKSNTSAKEREPRKKLDKGTSKSRRSECSDGRSKSKTKRSGRRSISHSRRSNHMRSSLLSEYESDGDYSYEDMSVPYKRPKPMPFTSRITRFSYHQRVKLPHNICVFEGNKDPEDQISIFSAAAKSEEWPMLVWCKMFR